MQASDFKIGDEFNIQQPEGVDVWRVTDVGSRVITAIKVTDENPLNLSGPPYSVVEYVWDEFDLEALEKANGTIAAS